MLSITFGTATPQSPKTTRFCFIRNSHNCPNNNPSTFGNCGPLLFKLLLVSALSSKVNLFYLLSLPNAILLTGNLKISRPTAAIILATCSQIPPYLLTMLLTPTPSCYKITQNALQALTVFLRKCLILKTKYSLRFALQAQCVNFKSSLTLRCSSAYRTTFLNVGFHTESFSLHQNFKVYLVLLNARSLTSKIGNLGRFLQSHSYEFILVSATRLTGYIIINQVLLSGCKFLLIHRNNRLGGDCQAYVEAEFFVSSTNRQC